MEGLRVLLADLGFRRFDVVLRVVDWSGSTVGEGTPTRTDTPLVIQGRRVKVRRVAQKDVLASGGQFEDVDYRIGPFTPTFSGAIGPIQSGGLDPRAFDPEASGSSREFYFKITGPGLDDGAWFKKIAQEIERNWSYYFTVRKTATRDP